MTEKNHDDQAFPAAWGNHEQGGDYIPGMTLRDYFAAKAMAAIMSGYWANEKLEGMSTRTLTRESFDVADAMLEARKK